jgi:hypothetical protein
MAAINQDQLALVRASQPGSFLAQINESGPFPLVEIPGQRGMCTRPNALLNYNMTNRNMSRPPENNVNQLSVGGGGYSSFEIKPSSIGGNIASLALRVTVSNTDGVNAVDLIGNLGYWIDHVDIIDQGNASAIVDRTDGEDLVHVLGMLTNEQQQKSLSKFNGQTNGIISEAVTVAAGASAEFDIPFYGEFFREIRPFMPAVRSTIEIRVYWHPWAKYAVPAAGIVSLVMTAATLDIDYYEYPQHIRQEKLDIYRNNKVIYPLLTQNHSYYPSPSYIGPTEFALTNQKGPGAFALVWMKLQSPGSLTDITNGVDLDNWTFEMIDGAGNSFVQPVKGKVLRLLETEEKLGETPFFSQDRKVYPIWFCVDPIAAARDGCNAGVAYFDGNMRLRLTPPSGTFNAGYVLNFCLYQYKTITVRDGIVVAQV